MLILFAVFANCIFGVVELVPLKLEEQRLQTDDVLSSLTPDCSSGSGKVPLLIPNPRNCRSLFICSQGVLKEFFCPGGKVFSPERQGCVNGSCRKGNFKKWPAFEACPEDNKIEKYFKHEEDCTMFYQCDNGNAVPTRCAKGTAWNDTIKGCDHLRNVDCESRSFIRKA